VRVKVGCSAIPLSLASSAPPVPRLPLSLYILIYIPHIGTS
jgi:hypothetical protein